VVLVMLCGAQVLVDNYIAPRALMAKYDEHSALLTMDVTRWVKDYKKNEPTLEKYGEEIERYRKQAETIHEISLNEVRHGMFMVNCEPIKRALASKATQVRVACARGSVPHAACDGPAVYRMAGSHRACEAQAAPCDLQHANMRTHQLAVCAMEYRIGCARRWPTSCSSRSTQMCSTSCLRSARASSTSTRR
jgi:hypothetical protein